MFTINRSQNRFLKNMKSTAMMMAAIATTKSTIATCLAISVVRTCNERRNEIFVEDGYTIRSIVRKK